MAELNFDHTKDLDFLTALGISDEDFKDLNKKFAEMSSHLIMKQPKKSALVQKIAESFSYNELLVIGGGEIYEMALPLAQKIWLTRVHTTIEGDVYCPKLNAEWEMVSSNQNAADEKHKFSFDFECWKRK